MKKYNHILISILMILTTISLKLIPHKQIVQISIPKSGTYLVCKCIKAFTGRQWVSRKKRQKFNRSMYYMVTMNDLKKMTSLPPKEFLRSHLYYSEKYAQHLNNEKIIKFFVYRDPRDQAVSLAFYMLKQINVWPHIKNISFDDLLLDIIIQGSTFNNMPPSVKGVAQLYEAYMPWMQEPNILSIRFEDLVGSKGGGSAEMQIFTLQKIAEHLDLDLSREKIDSIAEKLFGGTETFREGKIGSWKKYFKEQHREAFKEVAGNILIALGYENDTNW